MVQPFCARFLLLTANRMYAASAEPEQEALTAELRELGFTAAVAGSYMSSDGDHLAACQFVLCSLESLHHVEGQRFDVVVIDEVGSIARLVGGGTMQEPGGRVHNICRVMCRHCMRAGYAGRRALCFRPRLFQHLLDFLSPRLYGLYGMAYMAWPICHGLYGISAEPRQTPVSRLGLLGAPCRRGVSQGIPLHSTGAVSGPPPAALPCLGLPSTSGGPAYPHFNAYSSSMRGIHRLGRSSG